MKHSLLLLLLCGPMIEGSVSGESKKMPYYNVGVTLGSSFTLQCSYNCSPFVRGCWSKGGTNFFCFGAITKNCTVVYHLVNVSADDLRVNYSCHTQKTDDPQLERRLVKVVSLHHLEAQTATTILNTEAVHALSASASASVSASPVPTDGTEEVKAEMKLVVVAATCVGMVLAALLMFLCLTRKRSDANVSPAAQLLESRQPSVSLQSPTGRAPVTLSESDNGSDMDVPYADIMITIRGVSTPELTQIGYLTPEKPSWWPGSELRSALQPSRSADRLYLPQPREISRKMSSNSEYAIITYA